MNTVAQIITIAIIDKSGRRFILLRFMPLVAISMFLISLGTGLFNFCDTESCRNFGSYLAFISIMMYLAFFSISLGPIPWTINSEIYPLHLRGVGNSASTFSNWLSNFIVAQSFLELVQTKIGISATFAAIGLFILLAIVFVYKLVPETKGKTLE